MAARLHNIYIYIYIYNNTIEIDKYTYGSFDQKINVVSSTVRSPFSSMSNTIYVEWSGGEKSNRTRLLLFDKYFKNRILFVTRNQIVPVAFLFPSFLEINNYF